MAVAFWVAQNASRWEPDSIMIIFGGFILVLIAGVMAGSALAPIKFVRQYRFENYWLINGLTGTVVIPWVLALAVTPHLFDIYSQLSWCTLLLPPAFAFSWGIASMLGGLCVSHIGLSLSYALIIGIGASAGSLVPLLYFSPQTLSQPAGHYILLGIGLMLLGLLLVTLAGREKESKMSASTVLADDRTSVKEEARQSYITWVFVAALAGILSAGLNFSFAFGQDVASAARAAGASAATATYSVWALAMLGGMVPNLAYPATLCFRNHSWQLFASSSAKDLVLSILLGVLFM